MGWERVEGYLAGVEEDVEGVVEGKGRMWRVDQAVGVGWRRWEGRGWVFLPLGKGWSWCRCDIQCFRQGQGRSEVAGRPGRDLMLAGWPGWRGG